MTDNPSMFLGTHTQRLDEKGRLILPAKFIDALAEGVVLTRGQEHCLYLFTREDFNLTYERIRHAPITSKDARTYLRVFLSGAHDESPDKQRRITIPPALREYAGLDRDLTILGLGDRIEIWDSTTWDTQLGATQENFADINEEVIPGIL